MRHFWRKNEYPKRVPHFYEVTNNSKERPDVWIESPDKSVSLFSLHSHLNGPMVLQTLSSHSCKCRSIVISITSDIRTVKSEVLMLSAACFAKFSRYTNLFAACNFFKDIYHLHLGSIYIFYVAWLGGIFTYNMWF